MKQSMTPEDFKDIAPYDNEMFQPKLSELVKEDGFRKVVTSVIPGLDYPTFAKRLLSINNKEDFQRLIMMPFLEQLEKNTTAGITISGTENYAGDTPYTVITNHRDIVLDVSFLNLSFLHANEPTTEVAIGDNLLIYDWIDDLVRLNKSFIVRRNLKLRQAFEAAKHLSAYIHFAITQKNQSVWIAQREGRTKDSNDITQESLIKMLGLAGGKSIRQNIEEVNLLPTSISYEYDPNDYLKAREFLLRRRDPDYKKTQRDDLFSMETGITGYKGRIHYAVGKCITPALKALPDDISTADFLKVVCDLIDKSIHLGYVIYPINYISYDILDAGNRFADKYKEDEKNQVIKYIDGQISKINIENMTDDEYDFVKTAILGMYANPLKNQLKAQES